MPRASLRSYSPLFSAPASISVLSFSSSFTRLSMETGVAMCHSPVAWFDRRQRSAVGPATATGRQGPVPHQGRGGTRVRRDRPAEPLLDGTLSGGPPGPDREAAADPDGRTAPSAPAKRAHASSSLFEDF